MKPTETQLASLRGDLKRYIDEICDLERQMAGLASTNGDESREIAIGRSKGTHSDPTGQAGTTPNKFRQWCRAVRKVAGDIQALRDFAIKHVGEMPRICVSCNKPIMPEDRTHTSNGVWHDRCWTAHRRGQL